MENPTGPSAARTSLEDLPIEIIEQSVSLLGIQDIRALRLCGPRIAAKVSQGCFRKYFSRKILPLTPEHLKSASEMFEPGGLPCLIQDVILLVDVAVDPDKGDVLRAEQDELTRLLSKCFLALKAGPTSGRIRLLKLSHSSLGYSSPPDEEIVRKACQAVSLGLPIVISSLQASGISVERLELTGTDKGYDGPHVQVVGPGHGIALNQIGALQDFASLSGCLKQTESFRLRITRSLGSEARVADISDPSPEVVERNFSGVSKLISAMPSLRRLELLWHRVGPAYASADLAGQDRFFFEACAPAAAAANLSSCSLRGISVTERTLSRFIRSTSARSITLEDIHIFQGTLDPVLEALARQTDSFDFVHLRLLFEEDRFPRSAARFFNPPRPARSSESRHVRRDPYSPAITRWGEKVKQKIEYIWAT